ncbi:hypothetical protein J5N97_022658 [Dioscorea zingiberensis]|uniref:Uncharacterized protein n=1 Tax=Dioscorea zingiberensis TaxID=325984 RepID=A0A9D5HAS4_9LILI|nr:hypothetical protein J5N97_022658 [Dioscorea zingiberensis]
MRCTICGRPGHNKRYHGAQKSNEDMGGQPQWQPTEGDAAPMDAIDTQVLKEHFEMVDSLISAQTEGINRDADNFSQNENYPTSQVINRAEEIVSKATPAVASSFGRPKLHTKGGKKAGDMKKRKLAVPPSFNRNK